jgi:hypothetical protein
MRTIPFLCLTATLLLPAGAHAGSRCSLTHAGETHTLEHVYAARVPDSLFDGQQRVRVLCLAEGLDPADLMSADASQWVLGGNAGILAEIDEQGAVVFTEVAWGGKSTQFSGTFWGVEFDGADDGETLRGRLATTRSLQIDEDDKERTFEAELEVEVVQSR